jgi:large subunit ribosomal protein L15
MDLSSIQVPKGKTHARKRVGRGMGSGHGKTSTRGHKGQGSRSGTRNKRGFEGGQMPFQRRVPKRGFTNIFRKEYAIINLERIAEIGESTINPEMLLKGGYVSNLRDGLKVLGDGELKKPVNVAAHKFSQSAKEKIEKAGGKIELIAS